jgi:hypothetical protein
MPAGERPEKVKPASPTLSTLRTTASDAATKTAGSLKGAVGVLLGVKLTDGPGVNVGVGVGVAVILDNSSSIF